MRIFTFVVARPSKFPFQEFVFLCLCIVSLIGGHIWLVNRNLFFNVLSIKLCLCRLENYGLVRLLMQRWGFIHSVSSSHNIATISATYDVAFCFCFFSCITYDCVYDFVTSVVSFVVVDRPVVCLFVFCVLVLWLSVFLKTADCALRELQLFWYSQH